MGLIGQINLFEQVHGPLGTLAGFPDSAEVHGKHQILDDGKGGQKLEELENHADVFATPARQLVLVEVVQGLPGHDYISSGGTVDACHHID